MLNNAWRATKFPFWGGPKRQLINTVLKRKRPTLWPGFLFEARVWILAKVERLPALIILDCSVHFRFERSAHANEIKHILQQRA